MKFFSLKKAILLTCLANLALFFACSETPFDSDGAVHMGEQLDEATLLASVERFPHLPPPPRLDEIGAGKILAACGASEPNPNYNIGGGAGYGYIITQSQATGAVVTNLSNLNYRLQTAVSGDIIFIPGNISINVGSTTLVVKEGVTLASDRGHNGSQGALLYTTVGDAEMIHTTGDGARVTGLRIKGPKEANWPDGGPAARGIVNGYAHASGTGNWTGHEAVYVDNCEIWGWDHAAVHMNYGQTWVMSNKIYNNQEWGLGYGVALMGASFAYVFNNEFAFNRHCVAGTGHNVQTYWAFHNLITGADHPPFDMHREEESCPNGPDCVNNSHTAGQTIWIDHNTIEVVPSGNVPPAPYTSGAQEAIYIRGIPSNQAIITDNWFAHTTNTAAIRQEHAWGNFNTGANCYGSAMNVQSGPSY